MNYYPTQFQNAISVDELYTIHYFEYYRDYAFSGESHDFWEFLYIDKGEIAATCCGKLTMLCAGQAVLYRPGQFHALKTNGVSAPNTVVISFQSSCAQLDILTDTVFTLPASAKPIIAEILQEARLCFSTDLGDPCYTHLESRDKSPFGSLQLIRLAIERLLIQLVRSAESPISPPRVRAVNKQNEDQRRLLAAQEYITAHLAESLTMEKIAEAAQTELSQLNRLFGRYTGGGIIHYVRNSRIRAACEMIRESDYNFSQIAEKTGFQSIHYFSRTFKQIVGMTPTEYAISVKSMSSPLHISE